MWAQVLGREADPGGAHRGSPGGARGLVFGSAQSYFEAIAAGADAFVTGEISPQAHLAREMGVAYIAAGHHATERYGAPAVAAVMAAQWGWSMSSLISTTRRGRNRFVSVSCTYLLY